MSALDLSTTCIIRSIDTRWASRLDASQLDTYERNLLAALAATYGGNQCEALSEVAWLMEQQKEQLGRSRAFRALSDGQRRVMALASALHAMIDRRFSDGIDAVEKAMRG